jgi:nucleoside-diphosphate-sugar epimerase
VLITGAAGFIGSAVLRAMASEPFVLRLLAHRRPIQAPPAAEVVPGDLTDPATLRDYCDGVTTVVHLAAEVGADPGRCRLTNVEGTRALLRAAHSAGVNHFIQLSTAAVHGLGPHRQHPEASEPAPASVTSASRYQADRLAAAAGAVVLRPFFVYGDGDRWYLPELMRRLSTTWFERGEARHSVVSVEALAAVITGAARNPRAIDTTTPYHVCEPEPVSAKAVLTTIEHLFGVRRQRRSATWPPAPEPRSPRSAGDRAERAAAHRRAELFAVDHVYASPRIWRATGASPGPAMLDRHADLRAWYAGAVTAAYLDHHEETAV